MKVCSKGGVVVHTDYRENIVVDLDHPILVWKANKDRLRPSWFPQSVQKDFPRGLPKIGSEHSEDVLTWNVLHTLQLGYNIHILTAFFARGLDTYKVYFWGHDADRHSEKMDPEVQDILNQMEPWGKDGIRQQTEPDIILRGKHHIVMVESKLGKPGEEIKAWQRGRQGMRREYMSFMENTGLKKLFVASFDYRRDGNRFYQLFRNYLLGAALASRWHTEFSLLAIVNALNSNLQGRSHQDEFNSFRSILAEPSNAFLITWQQICNALPKADNLSSLRKLMGRHVLLALPEQRTLD